MTGLAQPAFSPAELAGQVVLISGGARGMGEAEARLFVELGAQVVIGDVRDELGRALAGSLGPNAHFVHLDVTKEADWDSAVEAAVATFGPLTGLVNSAGVSKACHLADLTADHIEAMFGVNAVGTLLGMRAASRAMSTTGGTVGGGSIVNVSSVGALTAEPNLIAYVGAKAAVLAMSRAAAKDLGPKGIRVNTILPGAIDTPMLRENITGIDESVLQRSFSVLPLGRMGRANEIAAAAAFLISDRSSYITGAELTVDGGRALGFAGPWTAPVPEK